MIFDLALAVVVVISGLLAMARGFIREVLTLVAWLGAGLVAVAFAAQTTSFIEPFLGGIEDSEKLAEFIGGFVIFFITLLILTFISISLSNRVLDSRISGVDRTLGLPYGALRGLIIFSLFYLLAMKLDQGDLIAPFAENSITIGLVELVSRTADTLIQSMLQTV